METTIARDGTRITYRRSGEGPPLILVHETAANHGRWSPVLPALEERFTVYAMDRRGRGGSGDGHGYAIEREFEDAAAVLDSTGGPVNLLGHSCGALIAGSGYYHGTMEAIVTKIGPDKVLEEADTLCAGLYSFDHYNCAHGLSHGFMRVQENELFGSL